MIVTSKLLGEVDSVKRPGHSCYDARYADYVCHQHRLRFSLVEADEIAMANYPLREATQIVDIESGNAYRALVTTEGVEPGV
ncbi:MAG: hypothetical protein WD492_11220 [Alkalispirochaeta sp.]